MGVKKGFKETELGVIPVDWEVVELESIGQWKGGGTPSKNNLEFWDGTIPWASPKDFKSSFIEQTEDYITEIAIAESSTSLIPVNSILIVTRSGVLRHSVPISLNQRNIAINQDVKAIIPNNNIVSIFLFWNLQSNSEEIRKATVKVGTTVESIDIIALKKFKIPLPPLPEQQKIATVLSDTDALIAATEHLLAKKRLVKQATLQNLLSGKTRLPGFGGEWENKTLEEIANINMGQSPNSSTYNNKQVGIPLIQGNADIRNRKSIIRVFTNQITKKCYQGDIILTVRAPVGEVAIASHDSCIGRGVCSISSTIVNQQYLFYVLLNNEDKWKDYEQGSTFTSANSNQIKGFSIFISTDIEEQTAIAEVLTAIDDELTTLEQQLAKYRLLKQGLMQELLSGKTRLV